MAEPTEPAAPAPDSSSPNLTASDNDAGNLPSDPLLQSGCFIDPTATSNGESPTNGAEKSNTNRTEAATPTPGGQSGPPAGSSAAPKSSSNGGESVTAPAESATEASEESKPKRRRRLSMSERRLASGERPEWLPDGWMVEDRVRLSGATAGTTDKYYCEPISGRVFRSKKEVLYFLETGTKKKKGADDAGADTATGEKSGTRKQKARNSEPKLPQNFDLNNPPEKVTWVLSYPSEGRWTPFMDGKRVPDPTTQDWFAAFKFSSTSEKH